jgi:hypothetical protein
MSRNMKNAIPLQAKSRFQREILNCEPDNLSSYKKFIFPPNLLKKRTHQTPHLYPFQLKAPVKWFFEIELGKHFWVNKSKMI